MAEDDDANAVRGALQLAGAETVDRAREMWWHFQTPILRLPVIERGFTDTDPAAEVLHGDSRLRFFQHPGDLLFTNLKNS
jgi:hypothetical protein